MIKIFNSIISEGTTPLLDISDIGTSKDPQKCRFGPARRDFYCIHYVVRGRGFFNGKPVKAGQGFLIRPNSYQYYYPDLKEPWEYIWINSRDNAIENIFELYNADTETNIFDYNVSSEIEETIRFLKKKKKSFFPATKILEIFLRMLNSHIYTGGVVNEKSPDLYFRYAENYIISNLHLPIAVQDITKIIGIGQPYLYRIFKEKTELSPKQYINNLKLEKAQKMLKESDMSVKEIANSLGYADSLSFSKFFTLNIGVCPSEFRKS